MQHRNKYILNMHDAIIYPEPIINTVHIFYLWKEQKERIKLVKTYYDALYRRIEWEFCVFHRKFSSLLFGSNKMAKMFQHYEWIARHRISEHINANNVRITFFQTISFCSLWMPDRCWKYSVITIHFFSLPLWSISAFQTTGEKNLILIAMINVCEIIFEFLWKDKRKKMKIKGNEVECESERNEKEKRKIHIFMRS